MMKRLNSGQIVIPLLLVIVGFGILLTSGVLVNKTIVSTSEKYTQDSIETDPTQNKNIQLSKYCYFS